MIGNYPPKKETIIGAGIVGAMQAYYAYLEAKENKTQVRVTIFEKNKFVGDTTSANIAASLTMDEALSVVPRGQELSQKSQIPFNQPGGIRVSDVQGVHDSEAAQHFFDQVLQYGRDEEGHQKRTQTLLALGKLSMDEWSKIYDTADPLLKKIMIDANFNPCREPREDQALHNGYRIDLICGIPNAKNKAQGMKQDYESLGYTNCKILSPAEVKAMDPMLGDFCETHSRCEEGEQSWTHDAVALYRPGGCIDIEIFLPKFYAYLKHVMGQYVNNEGKRKDCFQLRFERNVKDIVYGENLDVPLIKGLHYVDNTETLKLKQNKHTYQKSDYVFCPGESVGTLKNLGFSEPAYAGFAGASLKLNIPIPQDKLEYYSKLNHCMEVHQEGVVLAWQARIRNNKIFIGVGGTKAFYGDQKPHNNQEFAKNRHLLQLNIINEVLPEFISLALKRETKGQKLTEADLDYLERNQMATRWVGTRAVAYDGFPTLGKVYTREGREIENAFTTTGLGSGGVSFGPAAVIFSRSARENQNPLEANAEKLKEDVLNFGSSRRKL